MNDLNQFTGEKVTGISLLNRTDDTSRDYWIEKILFSFESNSLLIEVNENTDEITIKVGTNLSLDKESFRA